MPIAHKQLQRVVLHHVAQRAGLVVEGAALLHAQVFGDGDLDVGDVLAAPDGLEQRIAEAHREQVLHRGLAQVVVDAKDLLFARAPCPPRLIARFDARSWPSGFSSTMRVLGPFRPAAAICSTTWVNRAGRRGHVHHHGRRRAA
jgi:hypothetical protein